MSVGEVLVAVEFVGRDQRALFEFVEDVLHVDELAALEVHVHAGAQELLDQHRQVEAVRVEAAEVAAADELFERFGDLREGRAIPDVFVRDAVDGRGFRRDMYPGVELAGLDDLLAVGHHFDHRDLDDAVFGRVHAGGFEVEEDDRALEV